MKVIIAGAGHAAHLAGVLAAHTSLPVIGVPIDSSSLQGLDSLLSTVQMPPGIPVATMALGKSGARNAGIFAAQMLALSDPEVAAAIDRFKKDMAAEVERKAEKLKDYRTDGVFGEMHLIFCRNVLIYFDKTLQNRVLSLFADSLD